MLPVFPLPDAVLVPHTTLRLHVFEPRYRTLVEDLLRGDRWLSVVLIDPAAPGDPPGLHEVAGAGRLGRVSRLAGGRFHVEVEGLERVRLAEVPSDRPYRRARAEAHPLDPAWLAGREAAGALREMLALAPALGTTGAGPALPADPAGRLALLHRFAARLFPGPRERQAALEAADARRLLEMVHERLRFWRGMIEAMARSPRPPDPRWN